MEKRPFRFHDGQKGAALAVRVTPGARHDALAAVLEDGTLAVHLRVKDQGQRLNESLVDFLARCLAVPPASIEIVAGENGNDKLVSILDVDAEVLQQRLLEQMD